LLKFVLANPARNIPLREVLVALANVERFAVARDLTDEEIDDLSSSIDVLSTEYRKASLPAINKLHELESHVLDFVRVHRSWGIFGEQSKRKNL
jgi:hypothetical protein